MEMGYRLIRLPARVLPLGDYIDANPLWGSTVISPRGELIDGVLCTNYIPLCNDDSPTFVCNILLCWSLTLFVLFILDWTVVDDTHEIDHFLICLSPVRCTKFDNEPGRRLQRADWDLFQPLCYQHFSHSPVDDSIDSCTTILILRLLKSLLQSIPDRVILSIAVGSMQFVKQLLSNHEETFVVFGERVQPTNFNTTQNVKRWLAVLIDKHEDTLCVDILMNFLAVLKPELCGAQFKSFEWKVLIIPTDLNTFKGMIKSIASLPNFTIQFSLGSFERNRSRSSNFFQHKHNSEKII